MGKEERLEKKEGEKNTLPMHYEGNVVCNICTYKFQVK